MQQEDYSTVKAVIQICGIIGLVVVVLIDSRSPETVSPFVYGIFGGSAFGAELKGSTLDRIVKWYTRK